MNDNTNLDQLQDKIKMENLDWEEIKKLAKEWDENNQKKEITKEENQPRYQVKTRNRTRKIEIPSIPYHDLLSMMKNYKGK